MTSSSSFLISCATGLFWVYSELVKRDEDGWENGVGLEAWSISVWGSLVWIVAYYIIALSCPAGIVNKEVDWPDKKLGFLNWLFSFFYSSWVYPNNDFGLDSWFNKNLFYYF